MNADPTEVYRSIGVTPIITASGSTTAFGGSKLRPEVMEAMNQAATVMVNIDELNLAAGEIIAQITQAEAGFVCSGASGGLVLQAAAVIAGADPRKLALLPNAEELNTDVMRLAPS
jgi:L-seryl-tRNA(Ser) seleniumtransferase